MEKYPDVEVRVFRGGESVGETHLAVGLQNPTENDMKYLQVLILKSTICCRHTKLPDMSWYWCPTQESRVSIKYTQKGFRNISPFFCPNALMMEG